MAKKQQKSRLDAAINKIIEFISAIKYSDTLVAGGDIAMILQSAEDGALQLNAADAHQYRATLQYLLDAVSSDEQISAKALETLFQNTIFSSLDINELRSETVFNQRLDNAIRELRKSILAKSRTFYVYHPVCGLSSDSLPIRVGKIELRPFMNLDLEGFRNIASNPEVPPENVPSRLDLVERMDKSFTGKIIALIKVSARDDDAAKIQAIRELRLTLDVINFFSDLIPFSYGHLYLQGDIEPVVVNTLSLSDDKNVSLKYDRSGPLTELSLSRLLDIDSKRNLGFRRASDILATRQSKLQTRLLAALQLAGRATIDSRKEEAFLLYAIALESLILLEGDKDELKYRLKIRIAHLLGSNTKARKEISKQIGRLYDIRSSIVHSGDFQVTDADLSLMRSATKNCILAILTNESFSGMATAEDLVAWFDDQILTGPGHNPP